jgi:hypothetical protein
MLVKMKLVKRQGYTCVLHQPILTPIGLSEVCSWNCNAKVPGMVEKHQL